MASNELPEVKLYWLDESRSQRILWLLEELKLPYTLEMFRRNKETKLAPPELEKVHPLGKSPIISVTPAGAGEGVEPVMLAESGFITQYLTEHCPEGKRLMPPRWKEGMEGKIGGETEAWMRYQYYLHYCEGSLMPVLVMSLIVGGLKSPNVPFYIRPISTMLANRIFSFWIFPNMRRNLSMIEGHLATSGGDYLCGATLTAADILMSFPLIAAQGKLDEFGSWEGGSWREEFPKVAAYVKRLEAEEGYVRSVEKVKEIDGSFTASLNNKPANVPILGELEIASRLKELRERDIKTHEQFKVFDEEIWPSIQELRGQLPKPIYMAVTGLLSDQSLTMLRDGHYLRSVRLSQVYSTLGKYDLDIRNDLILNLCIRMTQARNKSYTRTQMRDELIGMWKHVSQLKRPGEVDRELRFAMPSVPEVLKDAEKARFVEKDQTQDSSKNPTARALASMFLQYPPPQAQDIIPALLATLAVASDVRYFGREKRVALSPLLVLARAVLSKHQLTEDNIHSILSNYHTLPADKMDALGVYVKNQWPTVMTMLTTEAEQWMKPESHEWAEDPVKLAASRVTSFHKLLKSAYRARNIGAMSAIWEDMMKSLEQNPRVREQLADSPDFLDYWIFVWCAVRRTKRLEETIELMRSLNMPMTLKSYTAMMHGWKKCKDLAKVEALWGQLVSAGTKLDIVIWTERISALIELGKTQAGIQALEELVMTWKKAVQNGTEAQAVQPTIHVINAAFKGMLHLYPDAAHELLAWAGREGFEPNVRTFNILISESLRAGHTDKVTDLLRAMRQQGIDPDTATFTILLEEVVKRMDYATSEEQVEAVHSIFADMEDAGLKPNLETYGKMLYAVDGIQGSSDDAMAAVQNHMRNNGFAVTPHMVTILIERALRRDPPDIKRVRLLLKENKLSVVKQGDQTLWERVMSAHAISGETKEAMRIFDDLAKAGRPVTSLPCLSDLVGALLQKKETESAQKVIDTVLTHKAKSTDNLESNQRYWRHHLWFMARRNGLIKNDTIPLPH
ncbi:hypothetical protein NCS57_00887000 [Fusarium keratoplasticum]|uniref:Uncharacterized protein n=1 Tax=Fusarium keratoplasticum TaxID=1328300 RepID=A0ACC0QU96_9HYPO|nr:hypothetical protein NCS57_00887000 [Fusarium keratoplasticum]KAI8666613.1 hypothetical protein NCS57_00887000 [Fusarium keratoplasticum]